MCSSRTSTTASLRRGHDEIVKRDRKEDLGIHFHAYSSDVDEGGETVFPAAKGNISNVISECGGKGLTILPKKRDALLFWNVRPDGSRDPSSLHGGCPVIKGNKWACTKWFYLDESSSLHNPLSKKTKIQSKDREAGLETENKLTIRCKKCGQSGHNSQTC